MSLYVDKASSQLHSRLRSFFQCSNASYTIQKINHAAISAADRYSTLLDSFIVIMEECSNLGTEKWQFLNNICVCVKVVGHEI